MRFILRAWRLTALLFFCAAFAGCATGPPNDPLEPVNRNVFKFNDAVDNTITKPIAKGYKEITPVPIRSGVTNFFGNFRDVITAINDLLQASLDELHRLREDVMTGECRSGTDRVLYLILLASPTVSRLPLGQ